MSDCNARKANTALVWILDSGMVEDRFTNNGGTWKLGKYVWYLVWHPPSCWCQSLFAFDIAHDLHPPSVNIQQRAGNRGSLSILIDHEDKEKTKRHAYKTGQNETKRDNGGRVYEYTTETNGTSGFERDKMMRLYGGRKIAWFLDSIWLT